MVVQKVVAQQQDLQWHLSCGWDLVAWPSAPLGTSKGGRMRKSMTSLLAALSFLFLAQSIGWAQQDVRPCPSTTAETLGCQLVVWSWVQNPEPAAQPVLLNAALVMGQRGGAGGTSAPATPGTAAPTPQTAAPQPQTASPQPQTTPPPGNTNPNNPNASPTTPMPGSNPGTPGSPATPGAAPQPGTTPGGQTAPGATPGAAPQPGTTPEGQTAPGATPNSSPANPNPTGNGTPGNQPSPAPSGNPQPPNQ